MYSKWWIIWLNDAGPIGYEHCKRQSYEEVRDWVKEEFDDDEILELYPVTETELYMSELDIY